MLNETAVGDGPYLSLRGITKQFPGCLANDDVDLTVGRNEIHALLGENGAGKSTLVKIIYGVMRPDAGEIVWRGEKRGGAEPGARAAARHRHGVPAFLAVRIADRRGKRRARHERSQATAPTCANGSSRFRRSTACRSAPTRPCTISRSASASASRSCAACLQNPRLLIMDEPTSVLTPQEVEKLFETLRRLASEGCSILYISHKLEEIRALCDAATIMRLGRVVAHCVPSERSAKELAELMINARIGPALAQPARPRPKARGRAWRSRSSTLKSPHPFGTDLKDVGFAVAPGEILGVAGIAGNGQTELMDALSGEVLAGAPETIRLDGVAVGRMGPRERRGARRLLRSRRAQRPRRGRVDDLERKRLSHRRRAPRAGAVRLRRSRRRRSTSPRRSSERFDVRTTGPKAQARALSGGNLQKFLVGREVMQSPGALVVNQPTWGVDAGAAAAIYRALAELAENGAAVVIISQDLDEIFLDLRPRRGDRRRAAVAADSGPGGDDRTDRPRHGRRALAARSIA